MKKFRHYLRTFMNWRAFVSFGLVALVIYTAEAVRDPEISRFLQASSPASQAPLYFKAAYIHGGGVVPRGSAKFIDAAERSVSLGQLEFTVDKAKLQNGESDFDAVAIQWKGDIYTLPTDDDMLHATLKFVERDSFIAYTVSPFEADEKYFQENGLVRANEGKRAYVAQEFQSAKHRTFLKEVDLNTATEELPSGLERSIISSSDTSSGRAKKFGSYVNADFHIKYEVLLHTDKGKKIADTGGRPLRYYWDVATDDRAKIDSVTIFTFPSDLSPSNLQYRAVVFFQTVGILRQFKQDNRKEFDRFLKEVSSTLGKE